ncbi:hypothetical protein ACFLWH_00245 [Chloroflexota bacterium]
MMTSVKRPDHLVNLPHPLNLPEVGHHLTALAGCCFNQVKSRSSVADNRRLIVHPGGGWWSCHKSPGGKHNYS